MVRLWIALVVAAVVFVVYAIVDCAFFDRSRVRAVSKPVWILLILLVPVVGGLLWFFVGRGRRGPIGRAGRTSAPDDDPAFLSRIGSDLDQEERIRRLEEELAALESEDAESDADADDDPDRPRG
ncbi:MAG TPA: PLD nuclease N-terminal domain-containing protein [Candidatus Lumbricidophila sp.]|nr:PLD nuclease N-terminal domain-containing protein [Candidatus Lumbricidophila sp.]